MLNESGLDDGWIRCADELPPEGELVETKLDDGRCEPRNQQHLVRRGRLWWASNTVYVYYEPTHWRRQP